eukprot:1947336-Amphidinium_carterae.3
MLTSADRQLAQPCTSFALGAGKSQCDPSGACRLARIVGLFTQASWQVAVAILRQGSISVRGALGSEYDSFSSACKGPSAQFCNFVVHWASWSKAGFADKFEEFSTYQLGKYLNAKVPKPQVAA